MSAMSSGSTVGVVDVDIETALPLCKVVGVGGSVDFGVNTTGTRSSDLPGKGDGE